MKKNIYIYVICATGLLLSSSCGKKKEYESNDILLAKAVKSAAEDCDWEAAKALAYKAREQNPNDPAARIMFALALEQCSDLDRAVEEITTAASLAPSDFMAQYTKGRILFKAEMYQDCPAPLETAREIRPGNPQVLLLLAETYAMLKNYKESIKNYVALAKTDIYKNKPEPYNEIGVLFFKKKNYKMSLEFFNRAYAKSSDSPAVNLNLGVFWDTVSVLYKKEAASSGKAAGNALKYYTKYIKLTEGLSRDANRKKVSARIEQLKKH